MNKCLMGILSLSMLAACSREPQVEGVQTYAEFPQTVELKGETVPLDTALFRYPFRIRRQGDTTVVFDLHGEDYYFHAFRGEDFRYVGSFGPRGEAPTELTSAENIRYAGDSWWVLDSGKGQLLRYAAADSFPRLQETVTLDKEKILRPLDFVACGDTAFFVPDYTGESRFCLVDRQGGLREHIGDIPTKDTEKLEQARPAYAQAWRSFIDYDARSGVWVAATQLGEVLEVYHRKEGKHTVLVGPNGEPRFQISQGYGIPSGIMGFGDVQVTERAIYAVFSGRTFKELMQSAQQGKSLPDGGRYLYVFSLQGEPLCRYVLDRYVSGIAVDEQAGILWATDVNNDQPICRFRLLNEELRMKN